jgi:Phage integrase family
MDDWAWEQLQRWLQVRVDMPVAPLLCVISGPTRGRAWTTGAARGQLRTTTALGGREAPVRASSTPGAHAVEMAREGVPLLVIRRQLGHTNLGITSIYLQGIDSAQIIDTVYARPRPDGARRPIAKARSRQLSNATVAGRAPTAASPVSTEKLVVRRRTVRSLLMALAG